MKADFIARNDNALGTQLLTFKAAIGGYTTLGVSAGQATAQAADADYFNYVIVCQSIMQGDGQQWTAWKNLVRNGSGASTPPAPTAFPTAVPAVAPGIETRFRSLAKQIKSNVNYNPPIGEALGIEGAQQVGPDLTTIQPEITAEITGTQVLVGWGFGGYVEFLDLCEIEVDRADGKGFVLLTYDTTPNYTDTLAFPAVPAKWTYRAIYRVGDARVGQWSAPVSVMVG